MWLKQLRICLFIVTIALIPCKGQMDPLIPLSLDSAYLIARMKTPVPPGRIAKICNVLIRHYNDTSINKKNTYPLTTAAKYLLRESTFDLKNPTAIYAHGYVELESDESVRTVIRAYIQNGQYNVLLLDWSNMAYGDYLTCALGVDFIGKETGRMVQKLLEGGLSLKGLHLIGHSMGVHLTASAARHLAENGNKIPRLSGLDPAYPGFYPALLGPRVTSSDADFVDVIHTDGGGYDSRTILGLEDATGGQRTCRQINKISRVGTPQSTAHADFWPNQGRAKQPGCLPLTIPLTIEDFCSHHRSWWFWSESLLGGEFLARNCGSYDDFLKGQCQKAPLVYMGVQAKPHLRGNYYLRTGAKTPFALGEKGAQ